MKIVQFKDNSYGIRKINLRGFMLDESSIYSYACLSLISCETYLIENKLIIRPDNLKTKDTVTAFNNLVWQSIDPNNEFEVGIYSRTQDYNLIRLYYEFLNKKLYKNNLTKFDYGKAI